MTRAGVAYAEEGLALARELGDPFALGRALCGSAAWALSDDVVRAAVAYEEAVSLMRTTGVTSWEAMALAELGDTRLMTGDVAEAVLLLDEALALFRRFESPVGIAVTLGERAHAARMQGDQVLAAPLRRASRQRRTPSSASPWVRRGTGRRCPGAWAAGAGGARAERGGSDTGYEWRRPDRPCGHTARILAAVRTSLPEPVFVAAWEEGRALSFADALADALALASSAGEPPPPCPVKLRLG